MWGRETMLFGDESTASVEIERRIADGWEWARCGLAVAFIEWSAG